MYELEKLDHKVADQLLRDLRHVDTINYPSRLPNRENSFLYVRHIDQLYEMEMRDSTGHAGWFCAKIKAAADYHGFDFRKPDQVRAEDFAEEYGWLNREKLSQPARTIAHFNNSNPNAKYWIAGAIGLAFLAVTNKSEGAEIKPNIALNQNMVVVDTPIVSR